MLVSHILFPTLPNSPVRPKVKKGGRVGVGAEEGVPLLSPLLHARETKADQLTHREGTTSTAGNSRPTVRKTGTTKERPAASRRSRFRWIPRRFSAGIQLATHLRRHTGEDQVLPPQPKASPTGGEATSGKQGLAGNPTGTYEGGGTKAQRAKCTGKEKRGHRFRTRQPKPNI